MPLLMNKIILLANIKRICKNLGFGISFILPETSKDHTKTFTLACYMAEFIDFYKESSLLILGIRQKIANKSNLQETMK